MKPAAQHPRSVFVSYSRQDSYFVDLLVEMLSFHRIRPWHDKRDVRPASRVSDAVCHGLRATESMIVVLSPHAAKSRWVEKELFAFRALRGTGAIYPLQLAPCKGSSEVLKELSATQTIDFSGNMLDGFRELTRAFGKPFLPMTENRKADGDRRMAPVSHRLEFAFKRIIYGNPRVCRAQPLPYEQQGQLFVELVEAFHEEIERGYRLFDKASGRPAVLPPGVLESMILSSIEGFDALEQMVPEFFVAAVVRHVTSVFQFEPRERRSDDEGSAHRMAA